jgi:hypothetical protein
VLCPQGPRLISINTTPSALRYPSPYQDLQSRNYIPLATDGVREEMKKGISGGGASKLSSSKKPVRQACSARDAGSAPSQAQGLRPPPHLGSQLTRYTLHKLLLGLLAPLCNSLQLVAALSTNMVLPTSGHTQRNKPICLAFCTIINCHSFIVKCFEEENEIYMR